MPKDTLIIREPLQAVGLQTGEVFADGGCGAIFARAGVGKTALLVQLAINSLLQNQRVLHVSLKDPVDKVDLWYKEVFQNLAKQQGLQSFGHEWDEMLPHRFIMTFDSSAFSLERLEKKIQELRSQEIFDPGLVMIDGYCISQASAEELQAFRRFITDNGLSAWFTIRGHRGDSQTPDAFAADFARDYDDFFTAILQLSPEKDQIQVKPLKHPPEGSPLLYLDPATLLIRSNPA